MSVWWTGEGILLASDMIYPYSKCYKSLANTKTAYTHSVTMDNKKLYLKPTLIYIFQYRVYLYSFRFYANETLQRLSNICPSIIHEKRLLQNNSLSSYLYFH